MIVTYLYCQLDDRIEVSLGSFMEKTTSVLTENYGALVSLPCYIAGGFFFFGRISSWVLDLLCCYGLDKKPGSLLLCALITWFLCCTAVLVLHTHLPNDICAFFLVVLAWLYKDMLLAYPLPLWMTYLVSAVISVTVVASIRV